MSRADLEISQYYVLLALAEGPMHGYAIFDQIVADSVGGVCLRPSSLYYVITKLEQSKLIEPCAQTESKTKARPYRLTAAGRRRLAIVATMHERAARLAKERLG